MASQNHEAICHPTILPWGNQNIHQNLQPAIDISPPPCYEHPPPFPNFPPPCLELNLHDLTITDNPHFNNLLSINKDWTEYYGAAAPNPKQGKVTFGQPTTILPDPRWSPETVAKSRIGEWMQLARDRARFTRRIEQVDKVLSPILSHNHRLKIYMDRF